MISVQGSSNSTGSSAEEKSDGGKGMVHGILLWFFTLSPLLFYVWYYFHAPIFWSLLIVFYFIYYARLYFLFSKYICVTLPTTRTNWTSVQLFVNCFPFDGDATLEYEDKIPATNGSHKQRRLYYFSFWFPIKKQS